MHSKRAANSSTPLWHPDFVGSSPLLDVFARAADALGVTHDWPNGKKMQSLLSELGVVIESGVPVRLVEPSPDQRERYEQRIALRGEIEWRERDWHDFFNALVWATYPKAKAALSARHARAMREPVHRSPQRCSVRDALTLFDENGVIIVSSDAGVLEDVREFRWKRLFWQRRELFCSTSRVLPFGHALCEKALAPYIGLTAHALLVQSDAVSLAEPMQSQIAKLDRTIARRLSDPAEFANPRALAPFPVLGVPGWWPANERETFYDDAQYFRRGRILRTRKGRLAATEAARQTAN